MKTLQRIKRMFSGSLTLILIMLLTSFISPINETQHKVSSLITKPGKPVYKVTFIELGSVRCIPCQKMQSVMKAIEKKYGSQVKVVFHDVWTEKGKPFGERYKITAIPTQVFLDGAWKEFFRHEGYFPEEELVKVLNNLGVH